MKFRFNLKLPLKSSYLKLKDRPRASNLRVGASGADRALLLGCHPSPDTRGTTRLYFGTAGGGGRGYEGREW